MTLIKFVICCAITLGLATVCSAKEWRGIVPLKSTRADVGASTWRSETEIGSWLLLPISRKSWQSVWFQSQPCDQCRRGLACAGGNGYRDWRYSFVEPCANAFEISRDSKVKMTNGGFVYYTNELDGLTVETLKGKVTQSSIWP